MGGWSISHTCEIPTRKSKLRFSVLYLSKHVTRISKKKHKINSNNEPVSRISYTQQRCKSVCLSAQSDQNLTVLRLKKLWTFATLRASIKNSDVACSIFLYLILRRSVSLMKGKWIFWTHFSYFRLSRKCGNIHLI